MKASPFPTGPVRWVVATRSNVGVDKVERRRTIINGPVQVLTKKRRSPVPVPLWEFM